jgi:hypothetical protein
MIDRYELLSDRHTAFYVFRCTQCAGVRGFPEENLTLALESGTPATLDRLRQLTTLH